ncbi:ornithine cyclodeaminase family protein [Actinocatenispora comari]|uniref:Ornithine cyclodeaminase n=1 Tax=Actinocatenispora comari TaxID=2807577 RepID=A0A8J4A985_9ACTN|nr:ornithine cyclodeaminase family protein [Actinocatenispora comari]GIL27341.1 ornithine cyclodeaminase [Actinocatenispora comari]
MSADPPVPRHLTAAALRALLPMDAAIAAIGAALSDGLDPEADPARTAVDVPAGQLLLMPASSARYAGVKIAGVAPANPARGLPRITGTYLLLDGATLQPLATFDGPALTALRTPAVSAVAIAALTEDRPLDVLLYGTGPQAAGHVEAVRAVRTVRRLRVVGRDPARTAGFVARCVAAGVAAEVADAGTVGAADDARAVGAADDARAVGAADLVVCCTSARTPLFDGRLLAEHATVVAMGSHEPAAREVDTATVRRCQLYVEARSAALREAGDLLLAGVDGRRLVNLAELRTATVRRDVPRLFKGVGMAWQDIVVAAAAHARLAAAGPGRKVER